MKKILLAGVVGAILVGCYDQETRDEMSYLKHPDRAQEILTQCEARFAKAMEKEDSKAIIAIEKDAKCRAAGKVLHELRQMEREKAAHAKVVTTASVAPTSDKVTDTASHQNNKGESVTQPTEKIVTEGATTEKGASADATEALPPQASLMTKAEQEIVLETEKLVEEAPQISEHLIQQDQIFQAHKEGERLAALAQSSSNVSSPNALVETKNHHIESEVTDNTERSQSTDHPSSMKKELAEMVAPELAITETSMPAESAITTESSHKALDPKMQMESEEKQLQEITEHKDRIYEEDGDNWQALMVRYLDSDCAHATGYPTAECVALKEHYHEAMVKGRELLWQQSFATLLGEASKYCPNNLESQAPLKGSSCELWQDMRDEKGKLLLLDLDVFGVEAQYATFCQNQKSSLCSIWHNVWDDKSAELTAYLSNNDAAFTTTYNRCYQEIIEIDDSSSLRREKIEKEKAIRTSTPCMQAAEAYRNRHLGERAFMHTIEIAR